MSPAMTNATDRNDATAHSGPDENLVLRRAIARIRAGIMAVTFGMTAGAGLFVATIWLVIRGGETVGPHLALLSNYFPGYTVTWWGAFLGAAYAAVLGALVGASIAWIYNRIAFARNGI